MDNVIADYEGKNKKDFDPKAKEGEKIGLDDIIVYKRTAGDSNVCPYCRAAYIMPDGMTPRVYRLSDLMAAGTNVGRKAKAWQATIDTMHPQCRCTFHTLPPGWGFTEAGEPEFGGEVPSLSNIEPLKKALDHVCGGVNLTLEDELKKA